jgi:carnosine N-methyltransferase
LSSNFILNNTERKDQFEIFPFVHGFSNLLKENDPFESIKFPDVCPNEVMVGDTSHYDFSMVAGEFIEVYQNQARKCLISCNLL